jgi:hypothetical protein
MPLDDQAQTRLAVAALAAAFAETLREQDGSFPSRFASNLETLYREMSDYPSEPTGALETLRWTRDLLTTVRDGA